MKNIILLPLFMLFIFKVFAQETNDHFKIKFNDGLEYNTNSAGASILEDSTISIVGIVKGNVSHLFQLELIPTDEPKKKFTKGIYYFNIIDQMMDFVPGQSIGYNTKAFYLQGINGSTSQEWITDNNFDIDSMEIAFVSNIGFIEIEYISDSRIKGKFSCELLQRFPTSGAKKTMEGTFDVPLIH
ncbi:MAG TPA: hypothetical protein PKX92_03475 [Edaphocola sp.]|nr:hypothetical protein [Edaphocola sp.]